MATVPADLVAWFANDSPRFDRYGMPRIEIRYRVVEVLTVFEGLDEPHLVRWGRIREFRTIAAARRCRDRLVRQGRDTVLLQTGVCFWMTEDEHPVVTSGAEDAAPAEIGSA